MLGIFQEQGRPLIIPIVVGNAELPPALTHITAISEPGGDLTAIVAQITTALSAQAGRLIVREVKNRETQEHLEAFLSPVLTELQEREESFRSSAYFSYWLAGGALTSGLAFGIFRAVELTLGQPPEWKHIAQNSISSLIVLALLGAIARFAFVLGKSFMVESLRNNNRFHAISFGQFYLKAFGDKAQWSDIKDALQSWNIDIGSSFLTQSPADIDPQLLQTVVAIANAVAGKAKKTED